MPAASALVALALVVASGSAWQSSPSRWRRVLSPRRSSSGPEVDIQARIERALGAVDRLKGTNYAATQGAAKASSLVHGGSSRLFLDTADERLWAEHLELGLYHGITTNPVLLQRAGVPCTLPSVARLARAALDDHGVAELMLQAWGGDAAALVRTGSAIASLDGGLNRVVVKLPLTRAGVAAAAVLGRDGARVCMTACYTQQQALVACSLGAEYVAPYLGRIADAGRDGVAECAAMAAVVHGLGGSTRVLVASLRRAAQLPALAAQGCNTFTFSPAVADELLREPLTDAAAADFEAAAIAMGGA